MTAAAPAPEPLWRRAPGALVFLLAALVFANALPNDFTYDDFAIIERNPLVHEIAGVWRAFARPYWPEQTSAGQYRPIVVATYALDWAIAGGRPWWFHLVNVLWHAAATALVWRLLRHALPAAAALGGAALFAVHPVHVEAVANVVGRAELMMATLVLGALLLHRRGSALAPLAFAAALLCKENGIVFPALALAHDLLLGRPIRQRRALHLAYAAVALVYLAALATLFSSASFVAPASTFHGATAGQRLLTMATVVPEYVRLLLAPFRLSIEYSPNVITLATRVTPAVVLGLLVLALAVAAAAASWRRAPVVALALVWFAVAVSPVANVLFASGVVLAERTLYLPSVAASLLFGAALAHLAARGRARTGALLALALGAAFAARTWTRTLTWRDNKSLVLTVLAEHPESYRAHSFAAAVLGSLGDWPAADRELAIARRIFPRDYWVYRRAAEAAMILDDFARAEALLDTAALLEPGRADVHLRRAEVRHHRKDYRGAARDALRSLALEPDTVRAAHVVAAAASALRDPHLALRTYRRALARRPDDRHLHQSYAAVLRAVGDHDLARLHADSAERLRVRGARPARP